MIADAIALVEFLSKEATNRQIKSALFTPEGVKIEGSQDIEIEIHQVRETVWFYKVKEKEGYEFIYLPVIPSVYVDYGQVGNNLDANFFRFVSHPMSTFQEGGAPNVKVKFVVYGYKPSDLLDLRRSF